MHIRMCTIKNLNCITVPDLVYNRVQTDFAPQQPPVQLEDKPGCIVLQTCLAGMLPGTGSCFMIDYVSSGRFLERFWDKQNFLLNGAFAALWTLTLGLRCSFPFSAFLL